MTKRTLSIAVIALAWLMATAFYWVGFTGEDDLFYARYAYLFHRPPIVWWEFRMPAILAMRGSFLLLGPTEFAAVFPSLLASLAILASVAWFVGWPRILTWQSQAAMLVAAVLPIDVGFRSYPSANQISAGFLALGTVCILKGVRRTQILGSALLALGFMTHEISFFYVALFCVLLLVFEPKRFWQPVAWCVALSGAFVLIESVTYAVLLGDPLARLKTAAGTTANVAPGFDPDTGLQGIRFYMWPLQNLILGKQFGFDLAALLVTGLVAWRRLTREQQVLFATTFAVFLWLGYGSTVPWAYKPLYRQFHYYDCIALGVAALLPYTLGYAFASRERLAQAAVGFAVAVHVLSLAASGGWGANVDVSRDLLAYARQHPDQRFLTDVNTLNEMYVLNRFQLPDNIVCLNGKAVEEHLLVNKEPAGTPGYRFGEGPIDGVLVNREQEEVRGFDREFSQYLRVHRGVNATIAPTRYRWALMPLASIIGTRGFMIRSAGGELVTVSGAPSTSPVAPVAEVR